MLLPSHHVTVTSNAETIDAAHHQIPVYLSKKLLICRPETFVDGIQ